MKAQVITGIMPAIDAIREHGGLMVTHQPDGSITYGTPQGHVIHARAAKDLIRMGHVRPVSAGLLGGPPQLYEAVIQ